MPPSILKPSSSRHSPTISPSPLRASFSVPAPLEDDQGPPPDTDPFAFVTLLTSDSYLAGALTTIRSLLDIEGIHPRNPFQTVCIVTPNTVGQDAIKALHKTFDQVIGVEEITTQSWGNLDLLGRQDLSATLTKLHLFRLTQFKKAIFLDADTLVLRPLSHLFSLEAAFSAAPDSGWPDAFNSGFMVTTPSEETFDGLVEMMKERGSWDGGDQGLLNDFFPNWNRLSFTYNVTPTAYYTYAPAYRRHGNDASVLHFIGKTKPWHRGTRGTYVHDAAANDYYGLVNKWFDVFERHFGLASTYDVASRVVNPPSSFKSTYYSLPSKTPEPAPAPPAETITKPMSIDIPTVAPPPVWDPARSSPPRNSGYFQMGTPITEHYENVWDDPSKRKQKVRFEEPKSYPAPPKETHDWYKEIMAKAPDPSAVKPVFPWEEKKEAAKPSRSFPEEDKALTKSLDNPQESSSYSAAPPSRQQPVFVNAWDSIPGIGKYAQSLAKATAPSPRRRSSASDVGGFGLGNRQSSLKEPKQYDRRSDASSRDGDDEDEEETNSSDDDQRYKIVFKRQPSSESLGLHSRSRSGSSSTITSASTSAGTVGPPSEERDRTPTPGSPTKSRRGEPKLQHRDPTSPRIRGSPSFPTEPPAHHSNQHHQSTGSGGAKPSLRVATGASPIIGATSPRLAAQALRNSTAARLTSSGSGNGDGPAIVRATRVFSPDTDTTQIKEQRLATLQRFVETMEAETGSSGLGLAPPAGVPPPDYGGGRGSGGAYRY
ncbi:glycosyltransferase family 8 protein [Pseudohyphozyma bogoriensis]|nr:glycosyltransferase family 8 protein [Pseudohyphozyma bogoriensis]